MVLGHVFGTHIFGIMNVSRFWLTKTDFFTGIETELLGIKDHIVTSKRQFVSF